MRERGAQMSSHNARARVSSLKVWQAQCRLTAASQCDGPENLRLIVMRCIIPALLLCCLYRFSTLWNSSIQQGTGKGMMRFSSGALLPLVDCYRIIHISIQNIVIKKEYKKEIYKRYIEI